MAAIAHGLRDAIKAISPPWLRKGTAEKLLYVFGLVQDMLVDKCVQAVKAWMPTQTGTPTSLPYIGLDRLMPQGLIESSAAYGIRLSQAFDAWKFAGTPRGKLSQIVAYLTGFSETVMQVATGMDDTTASSVAKWDTYVAGSTDPSIPPIHAVVEPRNWSWATRLDAEWWRVWVIIFAVGSPTWASSIRKWGDGTWKWGDTNISWGFEQSSGVFSALRSIVGLWKAANAVVPWIVVSFGNANFLNGLPFGDASLPDGNWGAWSKVVGTTRVPSRFSNCRYVDGVT